MMKMIYNKGYHSVDHFFFFFLSRYLLYHVYKENKKIKNNTCVCYYAKKRIDVSFLSFLLGQIDSSCVGSRSLMNLITFTSKIFGGYPEITFVGSNF